jgi:hypothetical protein
VAIGIALATPAAYRAVAWVAAAAVLAVAPSVTTFLQHERFGFLVLAIAVGFALVVVSFRIRGSAREPGRQGTAVLGVLNATLPTTLLFLAHGLGDDGLPTLRGPYGKYLVALVAVSALLVASSYAFGRGAVKKELYRLIEFVGLVQLFGAFTLASIVRYDDWFYPAACLGAAAGVLALGIVTRRATLAVLASAALIANLSIQYFAKLRDVVPTSMLVIGFGVVLLAGGVLYERRVRHLLPRLRAWS